MEAAFKRGEVQMGYRGQVLPEDQARMDELSGMLEGKQTIDPTRARRISGRVEVKSSESFLCSSEGSA